MKFFGMVFVIGSALISTTHLVHAQDPDNFDKLQALATALEEANALLEGAPLDEVKVAEFKVADPLVPNETRGCVNYDNYSLAKLTNQKMWPELEVPKKLVDTDYSNPCETLVPPAPGAQVDHIIKTKLGGKTKTSYRYSIYFSKTPSSPALGVVSCTFAAKDDKNPSGLKTMFASLAKLGFNAKLQHACENIPILSEDRRRKDAPGNQSKTKSPAPAGQKSAH